MDGVLVGVDDSVQAVAALRWAVRYARDNQLPVRVMTVVDPMIATARWSDPTSDDSQEGWRTAAAAELDVLLAKVRAELGGDLGVPVTTQVVVGHPVHELTHAARGADLLVVGSPAGAGLTRLLGSTSTGVARSARCSLAIIRPTDE
jgi:nucleotide-binding universal stress UspA family protein